MTWDPSVLRKYNTTGHFRLLKQLRGELKASPLLRPKEGQTVAEANRSRALQRATEGRGSSRTRSGGRRGAPQGSQPPAVAQATAMPALSDGPFTVVPLVPTEDGGM